MSLFTSSVFGYENSAKVVKAKIDNNSIELAKELALFALVRFQTQRNLLKINNRSAKHAIYRY